MPASSPTKKAPAGRTRLSIPAAAYLKDHTFNGRPVLPAVEAMELLARTVVQETPHIDVGRIQDARFDKFLPLNQAEEIELWCQWEAGEGETVVAQLKSKWRTKSGIARTLTHAQAAFGKVVDARPSIDEKAGKWRSVPIALPSPEQIYTDLVPFGPSYRNISAISSFDEQGIRAEIYAPDLGGPWRLGSPFVLDAALHAACMWGQRHAGIVAFPVGLGRRRILRPCIPGSRYTGVVRVREKEASLLVFDIGIENQNEVYEAVTSVRMRDVSGGRLKPPGWIGTGADSGAGA